MDILRKVKIGVVGILTVSMVILSIGTLIVPFIIFGTMMLEAGSGLERVEVCLTWLLCEFILFGSITLMWIIVTMISDDIYRY